MPATSRAAVAARAEQIWRDRPRSEPVLLLRAAPKWEGNDVVPTSLGPVRVVPAVSGLAVRAALVDRAGDERLVVLTPLREEELGAGLLAHAVRQRVWSLDPWDTVRALFGVTARGLDSSLVRDGELLAQALVSQTPAGGWPRQATGVLTRDTAYEALVGRLLLLEPRALDLAGLLDWAIGSTYGLGLRDVEPRLRTLLVRWLAERTGPGSSPLLVLCEQGHGSDALAVPLALAALSRSSHPEAARATGRLEQRLLGAPVAPSDLDAWERAARGWVERATAAGRITWRAHLARADELLEEAGAADAAARSDLLPSGFRARLDAAGQALQGAVSRRGRLRPQPVEQALQELERHHLAEHAPSTTSVRDATRLVRWLATHPTPGSTLNDSLLWQVGEGGWVDRARQTVWNGVSEPSLASGLTVVLAAAAQQRLAIDRAAATQLSVAVAADQRPGSLVPVEDAMTRTLLPLAGQRPVLVALLDGMSAAVAAELADDLARHGWSEVVPDQTGTRQGLLAGIPTVTEVSRTSLLCGRLTRGGQQQERDGVAAVTEGRGAVLHAADLAGAAGAELPRDVRDTVLDVQRSVVVAVLNAVDDALDGGDPARTRWTVDAVRHLRPLLEQAAAVDRIVVMVSDHGHVVDRPDEGPGAQQGWWRSPLAARHGRARSRGRGAAGRAAGAARRRAGGRRRRRDAAVPAAPGGLPRRGGAGRAGDPADRRRAAGLVGARRVPGGSPAGPGLVGPALAPPHAYDAAGWCCRNAVRARRGDARGV